MCASRTGSPMCPKSGASCRACRCARTLRLGLVASPNSRREAELIDHIAEIFPRLTERLDQAAITMSGGEQQMLAIARAMIVRARTRSCSTSLRKASCRCWSTRCSSCSSAMKAAGHDDPARRAECRTRARHRRPRLCAGPGRDRPSRARRASCWPTPRSRSATAPFDARAFEQGCGLVPDGLRSCETFMRNRPYRSGLSLGHWREPSRRGLNE